MALFDGTGPCGCGPRTGRGPGFCGCCRWFCKKSYSKEEKLEILSEQEKNLEETLDEIRKEKKELESQD